MGQDRTLAEEMFTIVPLRCSRIPGRTAWISKPVMRQVAMVIAFRIGKYGAADCAGRTGSSVVPRPFGLLGRVPPSAAPAGGIRGG